MMRDKLLNGSTCAACVIIAAVLILCGSTLAEEKKELGRIFQVPAAGSSISDFVPPGWKLEGRINGDLTGDGKDEAVLEFIEDLPERAGGGISERNRALIIVTQESEGRLSRIAVAERLLRCTACFGPMGGAPSVQINRGVLIVSHLYGSRETVDYTLRFKYQPRLKRFLLIGEDVKRTDRAVGRCTAVSTNLLAGVQIVSQYEYEQKTDQWVATSRKKQKVPKTKTYIEQIDYDSY